MEINFYQTAVDFVGVLPAYAEFVYLIVALLLIIGLLLVVFSPIFIALSFLKGGR